LPVARGGTAEARASPAAGRTAARAVVSGCGRQSQGNASDISPAVQREYEGALDALNAGHTEEAARVFRALTLTNSNLGGPHANLGMI